jgi:hypothetical protein
VIWMILEGRGNIACDHLPNPLEFGVGDTVLIPAAIQNGRVRTHDDAMWLEVTLPIPSSLTGLNRLDRPTSRRSTDPPNDFVQLDLPNTPDS